MQLSTEAIVIGGGVIGASTCYHLAANGVRNILLEAGPVAGGTTRYSAAWIMLQQVTELKIRMSQIAFPEFEQLDSDRGIGLQQFGSLVLITEGTVAAEAVRVKLQQALGVPTTTLAVGDLDYLRTVLDLTGIVSGTYSPSDGAVDPVSLVHAYLAEAELKGARILQHTPVLDIRQIGSRYRVQTPDDTIDSAILVNAAGGDARNMAAQMGLELPLSNDLRHIVYVRAFPDMPARLPLLEVLDTEPLFVGEKSGILDYTIGKLPAPEVLHRPNLEELLLRYGEALRLRAPRIADATVLNCVAGVRCYTADGLPIIGDVPGLDGFINNCGWAGHGVMHAPVAGRAVAQLVTGQQLLPFDLQSFSATRFSEVTCASQSSRCGRS